MKKAVFLAIVAIVFAACKQEPENSLPANLQPIDILSDSLPADPQPIDYPAEQKDPVTNDFTLVHACVGMSETQTTALLKKHGFSIGENDLYQKTEGDITKTIEVYSTENVCMTMHSSDFSKQKTVFGQWVTQMRQSAAFANMVRSSYEFCSGWGNERQSCDTPEELLALVEPINTPDKGMSASVNGNDCFANQYELFLYPGLNTVYLQIYNSRAGKPSDDFTESDLKKEDLHKHILISKVDYLTFSYKGFYAMNVSDKINSGTEIPFIAEYEPACDFGSIKLFYGNKNNLLLDGTIIWSGCGRLGFPDSFRAGLPMASGLQYPGQQRFAFIGNDGKYSTVDNERDLQYIWESISKQKEFQYYYANSSKKVAVYLYTPSVGMMDPNVACYFVFTEQ